MKMIVYTLLCNFDKNVSILLRVVQLGLNSKDGSILVPGSSNKFALKLLKKFHEKLSGILEPLLEMFKPKYLPAP